MWGQFSNGETLLIYVEQTILSSIPRKKKNGGGNMLFLTTRVVGALLLISLYPSETIYSKRWFNLKGHHWILKSPYLFLSLKNKTKVHSKAWRNLQSFQIVQHVLTLNVSLKTLSVVCCHYLNDKELFSTLYFHMEQKGFQVSNNFEPPCKSSIDRCWSIL